MTRITRFRLPCTLLFMAICCGCPSPNGDNHTPDNGYRRAMREFVVDLSAYAKGANSSFIVVGQNALDLLTLGGGPTGTVASDYVVALDGVGQEHPFYGEDDYDRSTSAASRDRYLAYLDLAEGLGLEALVTDYCWTQGRVDNSFAWNGARNYISFAAYGSDYRLNNVPPYPSAPYGENTADVQNLSDAKNFLYLIDPSGYPSRQAFFAALGATNYDVMIIDLFDDAGNALTSAEVATLKRKANGGRRLVLAYLNIGAVENWRYYWQPNWRVGNPSWIAARYEGWSGEYWVRYWEKGWQSIIYGDIDAYLDRIIVAGFDGVYLDNLLAYEEFE